ncbi:hypothetical protein GCM10023144_33990 [Pigmentiphaga soli]|uniref:DNA ligase D polymerase domain-containing protein n=1 Tax=Pigmentiphaga soli TaxID=1007095 RepID=A0ABP8HDV0_9BURK
MTPSRPTPPSRSPLRRAAIAGRKDAVRLTHAERVIDPHSGITKGRLFECYAALAPLMLPHLRRRPVALLRAPDGIAGQMFFQKHADPVRFPGLRQLPDLDPGHQPLLQIDDARALLGAVQMNAVEFHTWNGISTAFARPDRMVFDLDPGEGVQWPQIVEAAHRLRDFLAELGLPPFLKTSGGKGLHIVVPLRRENDWDEVKDFSHAVVQHLAQEQPDRFAAKSGPRNRVGKIFIDYLRNGFGATTVAAWSVRARPGLPISVPLAWEELDALAGSGQWHVGNIETRADTGNAPWDNYDLSKASLGRATRALQKG